VKTAPIMSLWILTAIAAPAPAAAATSSEASSCELRSRVTAERAAAVLTAEPGLSVLHYCQPCGDRAPGPPTLVSSVQVQRSDGAWLVEVNGAPLDLASTYVSTRGEIINLATLAGCAVAQSPSALQVTQPSETSVLIYADPRSSPGAAPALDHPQATSGPSLRSRWRRGALWILWLWPQAVAICAGVVMLLGLTLRRWLRRPTHVPRAAALMSALAAAKPGKDHSARACEPGGAHRGGDDLPPRASS
jgi:hypothetical protein